MNHKTRSLIHALAYQNTAGVHTYGKCSADGCQNAARGGAHCSDCVEKALGKEVGVELAQHLQGLFYKRMEIQSDIDELTGEIP